MIIPSCWREGRLDALLENLLAQSIEDAEFIVVFDRDRSQRNPWPVINIIAKYPEVRFLFCVETGCWKATNLGLAHARYELVGWTADDAQPAPDALAQGIERFSEHFPTGGGLLIFNDLHDLGHVAGHCITTKKFLSAIYGKPKIPPFHHWFADTLTADRAKDIGRYHYAEDIIWEHLHWRVGKSKRDPLNRVNEVSEKRAHDGSLKNSLDVEWARSGKKEARRILE